MRSCLHPCPRGDFCAVRCCCAGRASFVVGDIGEAMESLPIPPTVTRLLGVGHSMGGTGLILASLAGIGPFERVRFLFDSCT